MTDQQVLDDLKQNRYSAALKGLYSVFPAAKKFIRANSGTTEDAKDIFQDALAILCRKVQAADFILTAPLSSYLLAIIKNCWMQELRKRKQMPLSEIIPDTAGAEQNEEEAFLLARNAFELLGEKCRQLLILFYFRKQSFKTIAAALSFGDEKTAKNQKYRCLQKAKEHYSTLLNNSTNE